MSVPTEQRLLEAVIRVEAMGQDITEIKGGMRQLAEAINRLSIIEERQSHSAAAVGRAFNEIDKQAARMTVQDGRISALELAQPMQQHTTRWVDKAVWALVATVITGGVTAFVSNKVETSRRAETPTYTMPAVPAPR